MHYAISVRFILAFGIAYIVILPALAPSPTMAQSYSAPKRTQSLMLVRATLVALNHANKTGNYTVLRDVAAPSFRQANTAAKLGIAFAPLRQGKFDLSPTLVLEPTFNPPPAVNADNVLRIAGVFATLPSAIYFDLRFQAVSGRWKLVGIAVTPRKVNAPSTNEGGAN